MNSIGEGIGGEEQPVGQDSSVVTHPHLSRRPRRECLPQSFEEREFAAQAGLRVGFAIRRGSDPTDRSRRHPMQGVIKSYDPNTREGTIVCDAEHQRLRLVDRLLRLHPIVVAEARDVRAGGDQAALVRLLLDDPAVELDVRRGRHGTLHRR